MQYVLFVEKNFKENETFLFYLQYTGNEKKIEKLSQALSKANYEFLRGDYSEFCMSTSALISEQSVHEHLCVHLGSYCSMFQVCKGHFTFDVDSLLLLSDTGIAKALDENFFSCGISHFFNTLSPENIV